MAYIYPAPGVAGVELTLTLTDASTTLTGNIELPALQDVTINNSNDVFTWTQLDNASKLQVATTATNSLAMNIVLNRDTFFGTGGTTTMVEGVSIRRSRRRSKRSQASEPGTMGMGHI